MRDPSLSDAGPAAVGSGPPEPFERLKFRHPDRQLDRGRPCWSTVPEALQCGTFAEQRMGPQPPAERLPGAGVCLPHAAPPLGRLPPQA